MGHKVPNNIHGFSCSNSYYYLAASQIWIPTITTIPLTVSTVELSRAFFSSQALEAVGGHEWCKSLCGASDGRLLSCYGIFWVHLVKLPCSTVTLDGSCGGRRKKHAATSTNPFSAVLCAWDLSSSQAIHFLSASFYHGQSDSTRSLPGNIGTHFLKPNWNGSYKTWPFFRVHWIHPALFPDGSDSSGGMHP